MVGHIQCTCMLFFIWSLHEWGTLFAHLKGDNYYKESKWEMCKWSTSIKWKLQVN